jgi:hypothetical protein
MRKVGVVGSLVWDVIHGRDPRTAPVEEWGGIAYALSSLDAHLPDGWEIVPLIKVGSDLHAPAERFLRSLTRLAPGALTVEVPVPNNRVVLHYESSDRPLRADERRRAGWTWPELGRWCGTWTRSTQLHLGFELSLGTAEALRQGLPGRSTPTCTASFSGCSRTARACCDRCLTPRPGFAASTSCR